MTLFRQNFGHKSAVASGEYRLLVAGSNGSPDLSTAKCPICGAEDWSDRSMEVVLPQAGITELGPGLAVQPWICKQCGYVALTLT